MQKPQQDLTQMLIRLTEGNTEVVNEILPVIYDELRVGTNWADVTPPIPEPCSLMLMLAASTLMCNLRRRSK